MTDPFTLIDTLKFAHPLFDIQSLCRLSTLCKPTSAALQFYDVAIWFPRIRKTSKARIRIPLDLDEDECRKRSACKRMYRELFLFCGRDPTLCSIMYTPPTFLDLVHLVECVQHVQSLPSMVGRYDDQSSEYKRVNRYSVRFATHLEWQQQDFRSMSDDGVSGDAQWYDGVEWNASTAITLSKSEFSIQYNLSPLRDDASRIVSTSVADKGRIKQVRFDGVQVEVDESEAHPFSYHWTGNCRVTCVDMKKYQVPTPSHSTSFLQYYDGSPCTAYTEIDADGTASDRVMFRHLQQSLLSNRPVPVVIELDATLWKRE